MSKLRVLLCTVLSIAGLACVSQADEPANKATAKKPNVLFIAVDDLNHWVGHLGRNKQVKTPNLDRLAKMGTTFTRAYCAAPVCNPSRAALMSGLLPSTTGVYENNTDWRPRVASELTLNSYFRANGYWVSASGKIYHGAYERDEDWNFYQHPKGGAAKLDATAKNEGVGGIRFAPLTNDSAVPDDGTTEWAIAELGKKHDKPVFLGVGYHKPHMPWNVPRRYYDLYPLESIELPPHIADDLADVPPAGIKMAKPEGDHAAILESGRWKEAVQGYLAAISYLDEQVGKVLDAYDKSPERDNTIIVCWGDHGWHLGEKEHWRKFTLWEEATRAPLIWVVPGVTKPGTRCDRTVDFMSIYPTLCELAGLPIPKHVEGVSIKPLLVGPNTTWDRPALTTYHFQNHAVRTEQWRYIRYANGDEELYDEVNDPLEHKNLAKLPEHAALKEKLAKHFPTVNKPEEPDRESGKGKGKGKNKKKSAEPE
jgi:arylsulfatase A-like enzyme